jgi:hypothetical protein
MQMRKLLKPMAVKICEVAKQVFPFVQSAIAVDDDYVLVENQDMMIACIVTADKDSCYRLFVYDQITGNELQVVDNSFVDRGKALAKARTLVHGSDSNLVRQWSSDSETEMQAEEILQKTPGIAIESERLFLRAKFSPTRFRSGTEEMHNNLQGQH